MIAKQRARGMVVGGSEGPAEVDGDWFWGVIEASAGSGQRLRGVLLGLSREEVYAFRRLFEEMALPLQHEPYSDYAPDESEDGREDIAMWVVSQGEVVYLEVLADPTRMPHYVDLDDPTDLSPVAHDVYYERFGDPWPDEALYDVASGDPRQRVLTLQAVARDPTGDHRLLGPLQRLMGDVTVTVLELPYAFGEVRWEAAKALAAERAAQHIDAPVRLDDVPQPMKADSLGLLAEKHAVRAQGNDSLAAYAQEYAMLRALGVLPRVSVQLHPTTEWVLKPHQQA